MLMSAILKVDVVCDVAMTSTPNVVTTEVRDLLYNQWIDNTCCCSFFIHHTGRIRVCKIRFGSTDLVYKFKKIVGRADFSDQFRKIIVRYKRIGYNINIMRQSACLVFNPITVNNFASLGRQTQWWPRHKAIYFSWFGPELFCLLFGPPGFNRWFSFAPVFQWCCSTPQGSPGVGRNTFLSSPHLCFITVFICDLFVSRDDPLMS